VAALSFKISCKEKVSMALVVQRRFGKFSLIKRCFNYQELSTWSRISDLLKTNIVTEDSISVKVKLH
jgi:hypothetical protein